MTNLASCDTARATGRTFWDAPLSTPLSHNALLPVGSSSTSSDVSGGSRTYQRRIRIESIGQMSHCYQRSPTFTILYWNYIWTSTTTRDRIEVNIEWSATDRQSNGTEDNKPRELSFLLYLPAPAMFEINQNKKQPLSCNMCSHNQNCQVVITRDFRWNTDKNDSSRRTIILSQYNATKQI